MHKKFLRTLFLLSASVMISNANAMYNEDDNGNWHGEGGKFVPAPPDPGDLQATENDVGYFYAPAEEKWLYNDNENNVWTARPNYEEDK